MAKFDFSKAKIKNQVVAETIGVVNFGAAQNKDELVSELKKLISEIHKATENGIVIKGVSDEVKAYIQKGGSFPAGNGRCCAATNNRCGLQ